MPARILILPGYGEPHIEIKEIKQKLLELPGQITEAKKRAWEQKARKNEVRDQLENIQAEIMCQINTAVNSNGKPLFSNESARNAELKRRLAANTEYQELKTVLGEIEARQFEAETEAGQLADEFRAWKTIAELTAAELVAVKN